MHISKDLPQFENTKVLVAVLSSKDAKFYVASNSIMEELESFRLDEPKYSNDWTVRGVNSDKISSSRNSAYRSRKNSILTDFLHEFSKHLSGVVNKFPISKTFIFCPSYMDRRIRAVLTTGVKKSLVAVYHGNYVKMHPFELLEMIEADADIEDILREDKSGEVANP